MIRFLQISLLMLISILLGTLKARKFELESLLDASKRPDGILIKYFQLVSAAKKELQTLEELKIQSMGLSLEKEKSKEPWELITKPTLLKEQISDVTLQIKQLKEGIELKPGTEVIYNDRGNKATIIAFNKRDPKKGIENDYYILND